MWFIQFTLVSTALDSTATDFRYSFSLTTWDMSVFYFCLILSYHSNLHSWLHFVLKVASPRADKVCKETWQLVRSDYYIRMLKFSLLPTALASIIYPINLRLKILRMILVSIEVNLNGSLSRLKSCYRIDCRNTTFRSSLPHFFLLFFFFPIQFKLQEILFKRNVSIVHSVIILSTFKWLIVQSHHSVKFNQWRWKTSENIPRVCCEVLILPTCYFVKILFPCSCESFGSSKFQWFITQAFQTLVNINHLS